MKPLKNQLLLTLTLIVSIAFSCNNQKNTPLPCTDELDVQMKEDFRLAQNPDNPFDEYGKAHYKGILYLTEMLNNSSVPDGKLILHYAGEFERKLPERNSLRSSSDRSLSEKDLQKICQQVKANFKFYTIENASPELTRQVDTFSRLFLTLNEKEENHTFESIKQSIVEFEKSVLENKSLKEFEKEILLKSTSVSRYSAIQWEKPMMISSQLLEKDKNNKLAWYHWLVVIGADTVGLLSGGGIKDAVAASKFTYDTINSEINKENKEKEEKKEDSTPPTEIEVPEGGEC